MSGEILKCRLKIYEIEPLINRIYHKISDQIRIQKKEVPTDFQERFLTLENDSENMSELYLKEFLVQQIIVFFENLRILFLYHFEKMALRKRERAFKGRQPGTP